MGVIDLADIPGRRACELPEGSPQLLGRLLGKLAAAVDALRGLREEALGPKDACLVAHQHSHRRVGDRAIEEEGGVCAVDFAQGIERREKR